MHEESDALFQQGIMDSNPVSFMFKNLEEAEDLGTKLARRSGCTSGTWECLKLVVCYCSLLVLTQGISHNKSPLICLVYHVVFTDGL